MIYNLKSIKHYGSSMDPLSDVISLLRPHAALSKPISARGQWGVRYAAYRRPGFALVMKGACWLSLEGAPPLRLDEGDFILLPATPAFRMSSEPGVPCVDQLPSDVPVRHGDPDGEPDVALFGGAFEIDGVNAPLLLGLLPATIHIRAGSATGRLGQIIALLGDECAAQRPGADMIVDRLLEILLIECLRWRETDGDDLPAGLLAGLRDPGLARALRAIHADVRAGWQVETLAKLAGMSRSAFAARFAHILGCAPIEYLARWRMALAQDALARGNTTLDRIADTIGYESASAFSTAFRRRMGCSPGLYARTHRHATSAVLQ
jgi:AraC-like DNA-binding protein